MDNVKVKNPLWLRATGYLYRKGYTYNSVHVGMSELSLSWTKHYLAEVPQHFHLMLQDLYLAWKYLLFYLSNSSILSGFRGYLNRVFQRPKGLNNL